MSKSVKDIQFCIGNLGLYGLPTIKYDVKAPAGTGRIHKLVWISWDLVSVKIPERTVKAIARNPNLFIWDKGNILSVCFGEWDNEVVKP